MEIEERDIDRSTGHTWHFDQITAKKTSNLESPKQYYVQLDKLHNCEQKL